MRRFCRLIQNEFIKLLGRPTIFIMAALIPLASLGFGLMIKSATNSQSRWGQTPEMQMQSQIESLSAQISGGESGDIKIGGDARIYVQQGDKADTGYTSPKDELEALQYARSKEISPLSWKIDALYTAASLTTQKSALSEEPEKAAALQSRIDAIYKLIEADNWKGYLQESLDALDDTPAADESEKQQRQVEEEILKLRIGGTAEPVSVRFHNYAETRQWREASLQTIASDRSQLLSGRGENGALTEKEQQQLTADIAVERHRFEADIPPVTETSMLGFLSDSSVLVVLISLIIVIISGTIMASEYSSGTIKLLLISPHKRWKLFAAKLAAIFLTALALLVLLFVSSFAAGGLLYGFHPTGTLVDYVGGRVTETPYVLACLLRYLLLCPQLLVMTALSIMLAIVMRRSAVAIGVGVAVLFGGSFISLILAQLPYDFKRFILFLNTDLSVYFPSLKLQGIVNELSLSLVPADMTFVFSMCVLAAYFICFTYIALDSFNRRDIKQA